MVVTNLAEAELVEIQECQVARPVVLVVAALFAPLGLVVVQQVERVAVAKVESVEQAQVAPLVQHSLQHLVDLAERMKLRDRRPRRSRAATNHRPASFAAVATLV